VKHALHIESLRDLKASCSCGGWHYASPAFDREDSGYLKRKAKAEHDLHCKNMETTTQRSRK
jgi:hypothetical protein